MDVVPDLLLKQVEYERYSKDNYEKFKQGLNCDDNDLCERCYTSRLIGKKKSLVLHGGGNTSVKIKQKDIFNEDRTWLAVKGSGYDLQNIVPKGFPLVDLNHLLKMTTLSKLDDVTMVNEFRTHMKDSSSPTPSVESLLHALIDHKFVDHSHADAVVALADQTEEKALELFTEVFKGNDNLNPFCIVPYVMPGFDLAVACKKVLLENPHAKAMILLKHGLFTWGETAQESYEKHIDAVSACEQFIDNKKQNFHLSPRREEISICSIHFYNRFAACLRGILFELDPLKQRWIVNIRDSNVGLQFANSIEAESLSQIGTCTPDHVIRIKMLPLLIKNFEENEFDNDDKLRNWLKEEIQKYCSRYLEYFHRNNNYRDVAERVSYPLDPLPRVLLIEGIGLVTIGRSYQDCIISADIYERTIPTILSAVAVTNSFVPASERDLFDCEYWSLEQAKLKSNQKTATLAGKVCFITGGGSGIGLQTAKKFASEGASVFIADLHSERIDLAIEDIRGVKGVAIDITNYENCRTAFSRCIRYFGGVDIVVSNAGTFTTGGLDDLQKWDLSMKNNYESHLFISFLAIEIMKKQNTGGVLLFNISKAPLNPGLNQGPYAVAKAATGALMRQLSVECAQYGITSNGVNADRVRTNLFDQTLIEERANARGLSADEYFKSNMLKKEVTVEDVANAFYFLALSEKTTGMYFCVDGGCISNAPR